MALKLRTDYHCILVDKKTGNSILSFEAQQVGDAVLNASYEGGGIASAGQTMTIQTERQYPYNSLKHEVRIDGNNWIISSVRPSIRKKVGSFGKSVTVWVLDLQ